MRIQIQNFRGLSDLDITVSPIALLAGSNAAGKSSACTAIAAVASGSLLPFAGVTKKGAQMLVHDGCERANAVITTDEGQAAAAWPAVERATTGHFRDSSATAVGLDDLTAMSPIDRAAHLINLIGATPTEQDLTDALLKAEIPEEFAAQVWAQTAKGWDAAHAFYKDEGAKLKGQWEKLANERFGAAKALTWRPKGWTLPLEGASLEALQVDINEANEALDGLKRRAGADENQVNHLTAEADKLGPAQRALKEAKADLEAQQLIVLRAATALRELGDKPKPGQPTLVCPCCQEALRLAEGMLIKTDEIEDPIVVASALAAYEVAEAAATKAVETRDMASRYVQAAETRVQTAQEAKAKLDATPKDGTATKEEIDAAAIEVTQHCVALGMKQAVIESMALVERIQRRITIVGLLDKDGVRQTVLVERLHDFNAKLVENCQTARWPEVIVASDMVITYGDRPVSLCSAGEQYRARITLQLTVAEFEQAPLVVIDGADILDRNGRNGLLGLVSTLGIPAVIGMTILRREDMPDLARAGIGQSVWIEAGSAEVAMQEAA